MQTIAIGSGVRNVDACSYVLKSLIQKDECSGWLWAVPVGS